MSTEHEDEILDLRGLSAGFPDKTRVRAQLKKAKELTNVDISRFKVGKAYSLKDDDVQVFLLNAIVLNPTSAIPMGMGFLASPDGFMPYTTDLINLGKEVVF